MEGHFIYHPKVVMEILSQQTERIDRGEKFYNYTQISSLQEYVLVAQDRMEVTLFRRTNTWQPEIFRGLEHELVLPSIDFKLPLRLIYEGLKL